MTTAPRKEISVTLPDGAVVLVRRTEQGKVEVWIPEDAGLSPFTWGIALVDIARNAARVMAGENPGEQAVFLAELKQGLDVEWENPTDWPVTRKGERR